MKTKLIKGIVATALVSVTSMAVALPLDLTLSGGTAFTTGDPGFQNNDILGDGWRLLNEASISVENVSVNEAIRLDFFYLGSESGWTNRLNVDFMGSTGTALEDNAQPMLDPAELLFSVRAPGTGGADISLDSAISFALREGTRGTVFAGGGGTSSIASIAFAYLSCVPASAADVSCSNTTAPSNRVLFALDDGGAGPDDNHDDFVGYIQATVVPLPGAAWLFGTALLALAGFNSRKRQRPLFA